jgi:hypothetical protein
MTKSTKASPRSDSKATTILAKKGEDEAATMARAMVEPYFRHGIIASDLAKKSLGDLPGEPGIESFGRVIEARAKQAMDGDLTFASEILAAQALSLDAMMTELMRRSIMNFGDYPLAAERYARLAFKAQSNSRAALEALAKLHQPREQTVRHVHVNEGGQAVVAENFHAHPRVGDEQNAKSVKQSHATFSADESAALLSEDAQGHGVPISSRKGTKTVQDARRE